MHSGHKYREFFLLKKALQIFNNSYVYIQNFKGDESNGLPLLLSNFQN